MKYKVSAPSNIALIKYMGKIDANLNKPTNTSFSMTLNHLLTFVEIEPNAHSEDRWELLKGENLYPMSLSDKGQLRFLKHFQFLKQHFKVENKFFTVRSANNFPSDCGLASSASSFAALTQCTYEMFSRDKKLDLRTLGELSRQGSGSSCRSLAGPWVLWGEKGIEQVKLPYGELLHMAVVVEDEKKLISSSEAHKRVSHSSLFVGRPERAEKRVQQLLQAMQTKNWREAYEISWAEFWDMHALFETCNPHFSYMNSASLSVLRSVEKVWEEKGDGPLCTMDAGPNIHLLFRPEQKQMLVEFNNQWKNQYKVFANGMA